jgi:hypothetical protein
MWDTLLDQSLTVKRANATQDASAGTLRTFAVVIQSTLCSVQPASSHEINAWKLRSMVIDTMIYSVTDFDAVLAGGLRLGDQFIDAAGSIFNVVGVMKNLNLVLSTQPLYQVACKRIK